MATTFFTSACASLLLLITLVYFEVLVLSKMLPNKVYPVVYFFARCGSDSQWICSQVYIQTRPRRDQ
jgi:hypothetical protein